MFFYGMGLRPKLSSSGGWDGLKIRVSGKSGWFRFETCQASPLVHCGEALVMAWICVRAESLLGDLYQILDTENTGKTLDHCFRNLSFHTGG